ncbi:MAG TPA: ATP synthase F1 subunit delta [Bacteroidetes bacterium]|nr:ATP synthase F1 subunit delta [Bacteroidota bacterium]
MNESKISVRYARALFQLCEEKDAVEEVYRDVTLIDRVMKENPDLGLALESQVIPPSRKEKILTEIFGNRTNQATMQLMRLIIKNNRESYIPMIMRQFMDLVKKKKGITEVVLTTAQPISADMTDELKQLVAGKIAGTFEMKTLINPAIIGGFILRVDDLQLDASVRKELDRIKKTLIRGFAKI